jgi:hypothetical protein
VPAHANTIIQKNYLNCVATRTAATTAIAARITTTQPTVAI